MESWYARLQKIYMILLKPAAKAVENISERGRERMICALFAVVFLITFLYSGETLLWWGVPHINLKTNIVLTVALILTSVLSVKGELRPVVWRKAISVPLFLCGLGLVITGLIHPIGDGYLSFGFMLLFVYPLLYFVWTNRRDYSTLFMIISESFLGVSLLYFVYSTVMMLIRGSLKHGRRFSGMMRNSNIYSMIGMVMFAISLYLLYEYFFGRKRRRTTNKVIFCILAAVIGVTIMILGKSRACILASGINLLVTLFFVARYARRSRRINSERPSTDVIKNRKKVLVMVIAVALIVSLVAVSLHQTEGGERRRRVTWYSRFVPDDEDLNGYTTGRVDIWKSYGRYLNLTGNNFDETDWADLTNNKVGHAHNNFFEYGYRCGVPVALLFIILELMAGLISLRYLFYNERYRSDLLFVVIFMVIYALESMVDVATIPMERYAPLFFYFIVCPMLDRYV